MVLTEYAAQTAHGLYVCFLEEYQYGNRNRKKV